MPNVFNPQNIDRLDNPARRELIPPRETLEKIGLTYGDVFVDIGAGAGYFSLPAAEITGTAGHVIATDISSEMLDALNKNARDASLSIETLLSPSGSIPLPDNTADLTFMAFVFHELDDRSAFLSEMRRVTKPTGTIVIIDWEKVDSPVGPPPDHRISLDEALAVFRTTGLRIKAQGLLNDCQYFIAALPA